MPRLVHRPPSFRLHKSTQQAVVSLFGEKVYLGPYGSPRSHERYQEILKKWERLRHQMENGESEDDSLGTEVPAVPKITAAKLRDKRRRGVPITISEVIYVYRGHTHAYYRKNGEVTREAGVIDDALRILRKHYGTSFVSSFGPVAFNDLRDKIIEELDWSRKYINKQVNRIRSMFKWASANEIVDATVAAALRELAGLKKGRLESTRDITRNGRQRLDC